MATYEAVKTPTAEDRMIAALERIAAAQEAIVAADPIAALGAVIGEDDHQSIGWAGPDYGTVLGDHQPEQPSAYNGVTATYALPDVQGWEIVARRDATQPSGWDVGIEMSND